MAEEKGFLGYVIDPIAGIISSLTGMPLEDAKKMVRTFVYITIGIIALFIVLRILGALRRR